MPDLEVLSIERDDHVATVWLDRPEARNAMGPELWTDLPRAMHAVSEEAAVRVVVVAARGPHFSVGLDLKARAGPQLGAAQTLAVYLGLDGLAGKKPTVDETVPDRDPLDGTRVRHMQWGPGKDGKIVTLYTVVGGGSPFPGGLPDTRDFAKVGRVTRDLSGASVIVRFALETH